MFGINLGPFLYTFAKMVSVGLGNCGATEVKRPWCHLKEYPYCSKHSLLELFGPWYCVADLVSPVAG